MGFWSTCNQRGACSFWIGVTWLNCQLVFEMLVFAGFTLIAKGWREWGNALILTCFFYILSSTLLALKHRCFSPIAFWALAVALHSLMIGYIMVSLSTAHSVAIAM